jgi:hypothetical protein
MEETRNQLPHPVTVGDPFRKNRELVFVEFSSLPVKVEEELL